MFEKVGIRMDATIFEHRFLHHEKNGSFLPKKPRRVILRAKYNFILPRSGSIVTLMPLWSIMHCTGIFS